MAQRRQRAGALHPAGPPPMTAKRRGRSGSPFGKVEFAAGSGINHARNRRIDQRDDRYRLDCRRCTYSPARPHCDRLRNDLRSARNGRAIETKSTASRGDHRIGERDGVDAIARNTATSPTAAFIAAAYGIQTPLGTRCCTVGIDDSCQPMPTLSASTPSPRAARKVERLGRARRVRHQVGAGDAKDYRKVRAGARANRAQDLARQAHAPLQIAAPIVVAAIGKRGERNSLRR